MTKKKSTTPVHKGKTTTELSDGKKEISEFELTIASPEIVKTFENYHPGSAETFLNVFVETSKHTMEMEKRESDDNKTIINYSLLIILFAFSLIALALFLNQGAVVITAIFGGIAGLVGVLKYFSTKNN